MGRTENITDPSDAKAILVQFYHYFAYPDFPLSLYPLLSLVSSQLSDIAFFP